MKINNNRFSALPLIEKKASSWKQPTKHLTTLKTGDIVPVYVNEVMSGDNIRMAINKSFTRMTTPIFPVMDSVYQDIYWFYVPFRILYDMFPSFLGANDEEYGIQENEYFLPSVHNITYSKDDIASYMGLPVGVKIGSDSIDSESINTMYFKAYAKIFNEYFRDENLTPAYEVKKTYENFDYETDSSNLSDVSKLQYGIGIAKASKIHDLFTSALPFTQKGPAVSFNFNTEVPVLPSSDVGTIEATRSKVLSKIEDVAPSSDYPNISKLYTRIERAYFDSNDNKFKFADANQDVFAGNNYDGNINLMDRYSERSSADIGRYWAYNNSSSAINPMFFTNLGVTPSISFSVNDLRTAFQMQRFYELLARSGTRYNEFIKGVFGVDIKDQTVQRPELIASRRFTLNMSQVVQTSATDNTSPQGNTSGISATLCDNDNAFNKSFTEAGVLMALVVIRTNHTYVNRLPKEFSKKRKFDFYYPVFQALGEQPILNKEIFFTNDEEKNNKVFGYQEAWYEYRYHPSYISGEFISGGAYASWTYADYFEDTPILNQTFIEETSENVGRTLAVPNEAQFILDFYCEPVMTRLMPLYSIPGLIDHF